MRKIKFKLSGRIVNVENNVAHGFIDRGLAVLYTGKEEEKGLDEAPKDKMLKRTNKKDKIRIK